MVWKPTWRYGPARCLGRDESAEPLAPYPEGTFTDMYVNRNTAQARIDTMVCNGWTKVEVELDSSHKFFEMKDWCETHGALGKDWINVNLRTFMFSRKDIAALFKLTFV